MANIWIEESPWVPAPATTSHQVFAIGDVHGRADLLIALHAEVKRNAKPDAVVIHLGDYIDRGPASVEALKMALDGVGDLRSIALPGNHEQFLCSSLSSIGDDQFNVADIWVGWNGGKSVMRELGVKGYVASSAVRTEFFNAIRTALGAERLAKLFSLPSHVFIGGYLFVHAGVHPTRPIKEFLARPWNRFEEGREDEDPLWIRGPFLTHEGVFENGWVVVHGHSPTREPELLPNRLNVDTGAYYTGRLTAIELDGASMRTIQAVGEPG